MRSSSGACAWVAASGVRVRAPLSADLLRWGLGFLAQCTNQKAAANTLATLAMAQRSKVLLAELRDELEGDFAYRSAGKLVMLRTQADVDNAKRVQTLNIGGSTATTASFVVEAVSS